MRRPRYNIELFALSAPLVNAMQFDGDASFEVLNNRLHFRPGAIVTDPVIIAEALSAGVKYHVPGPIVISAPGGSATVQGQAVTFTTGQVVSDPSMIGVVAQNLIPYALQAGVAGYIGF